MALFVTVANGLVVRNISTNGELPALTVSEDPWVDVSGMNPHPVVGDHYDGASFVLDKTVLSTARANKIAELRELCAEHIRLLGTCIGMTPAGQDEGDQVYYVFPTKPTDQTNAQVALQSVASSQQVSSAGLWCGIGADGAAREPTATDWEIREFTLMQLKLVNTVLFNHISDAQYTLRDCINQVFAASTVQDVQAVIWVRPNA
jgi:hypothetical protein